LTVSLRFIEHPISSHIGQLFPKKARADEVSERFIGFGRAIRRVREEQQINQEEAASRCGLHRTYYSGVERGVRNVSLVNLERISKNPRVSMSQLFSRL
jgi:DNA-binding XRE family transcriptional regulator